MCACRYEYIYMYKYIYLHTIHVYIVIAWLYGSVSKPCTPGEHQNSW